jgi:murein DD-endopeptidase MepM/ murein hydrolase activator NlpD
MRDVARGRRPQRRIEMRIPLTMGSDLAFGISLRAPRARKRRRGEHPWLRALANSALLTLTLAAPLTTAMFATDLGRLRDLLLPAAEPAPAPVAQLLSDVARPMLHPRKLITTVTSPEPPYVRTYVVQSGDTLLSVAARFAIAPQTLAYGNGISDSAALRVGDALLVPPFDAALHVMDGDDTIEAVSSRFGLDPDAVRALNRVAFDDSDASAGRILVLPVPDAQYPGFRLRLSDAPRVIAPRVRWPVEGVITQLFNRGHTGIDIAAPYGTPIVAPDSGTVSAVGWRGDGGLAVCVVLDWGLETCSYHAAATYVEVGDRVTAGQRIAAIGLSGVTTGPHVHWEARTNGALVDPLTYATTFGLPRLGGATGSP